MKVKNLTIIKIGGSVLTYKERAPTFRRKTTERLIREFSHYYKKGGENFIIIHGAGSFGHIIAKKYKLEILEGKKNKLGVKLTRESVRKLNSLLMKVFLKNNLPTKALSPADLITHKKGRISSFNLSSVKNLLNKKNIPIFYGDVVSDTNCQFSICSGDQIVSYLAKKIKPARIIFVSDVDGIFTDDPKKNKKAKLIKYIKLNDIKKISSSMKIDEKFDVTQAIKGKLLEITKIKTKTQIINGLKKNSFYKALAGKKVGTVID